MNFNIQQSVYPMQKLNIREQYSDASKQYGGQLEEGSIHVTINASSPLQYGIRSIFLGRWP